jgi:deoxycytidylate deaminase
MQPRQITADEELKWMDSAASQARMSLCQNGRCGAVVVSELGMLLGTGYNGPPLGAESNRTCNRPYKRTRKPRFDQTCCVHAEVRAVMDALERHAPGYIQQARMYFVRVDEGGQKMPAGDPFCTMCSRIVMDAGVGEFALWTGDEVRVCPADDYDRLTYDFYR